MNNGFNGTGTAFILYILLAFFMPFVYVYRLTKKRKDFGYGFVFGHFVLGILVTVLAVACVSYLWRIMGVPKHGALHHILLAMAYFVIAIILTWALIPRGVQAGYWMRRKRALLHYQNPHIHPWFSEPYYFYTVRSVHRRSILSLLLFRHARQLSARLENPAGPSKPRVVAQPRMVDPPLKFPAPLRSREAHIILPAPH